MHVETEQRVMERYFKAILSPEDLLAIAAVQKNIWKKRSVPPAETPFIQGEQSSEASVVPIE